MFRKISDWFEKHVGRYVHMKDNAAAFPSWWSPSGWRVFAVTAGFWKPATTPPGVATAEWTVLKVEGPGLGTKMWENGILSFSFHLPFCVALHMKFPVPYAGERWGWALQAQIGWKVFGNLSATLRVRPDFVNDYNTPGLQYWRARGLREGGV